MNEPVSNLGAMGRALMRAKFKKLVTYLGIPAISIARNEVEALLMADHIALMGKGLFERIQPLSQTINTCLFSDDTRHVVVIDRHNVRAVEMIGVVAPVPVVGENR